MLRAVARFVNSQILERLRLHGFTFFRDCILISAAFSLAELARFDGSVPRVEWRHLAIVMPALWLVYCTFSYLYGIHRRLWTYAGMRDLRALLTAVVMASATGLVADLLIFGKARPLPVSVVFMGGFFVLPALLAARVGQVFFRRTNKVEGKLRVLIVGAGEGGQVVAADLLNHAEWNQAPVAFVDDDPKKYRMRVHGVPVLGTTEHIPALVDGLRVDIVGIAVPSASAPQMERILKIVQETDVRIQILPTRTEALAEHRALRLRDINLDDLLERPGSRSHRDEALTIEAVHGRTVLVTGAAGSIGSELCRQLLSLEPARVVALDNNETGLFHLEQEIGALPDGELFATVLADISNETDLDMVFRRVAPNLVFHAGAYKHVPMLERHPEQAVFVNVLGTFNLCRLASRQQCERFVFISTDKAVSPVNNLGFSKRIGELIVRAHSASSSTAFCCVRFGNVVGSRGSALPEFVRQIDAGGPVTVTHPDVERYFMTIPEAVSLVISAGTFAGGGELYMLDMGEPIRIDNLVKRMIRLRGLRPGKDIDIQYTGLRPGEKLSEELIFVGEESSPTTNPAVFALRDERAIGLRELNESVGRLAAVARRGDSAMVSEMLSNLATSRPADLQQSDAAG